jgi:hypothetical protein
MVHSSVERPARPTTQTSLWSHGKRRKKAWDLPQLPAKTAHQTGLTGMDSETCTTRTVADTTSRPSSLTVTTNAPRVCPQEAKPSL